MEGGGGETVCGGSEVFMLMVRVKVRPTIQRHCARTEGAWVSVADDDPSCSLMVRALITDTFHWFNLARLRQSSPEALLKAAKDRHPCHENDTNCETRRVFLHVV